MKNSIEINKMMYTLQQEQLDLDASYKQSLENKKEHGAVNKVQVSSNKGVTICKAKDCTNNLYKWTSNKDPEYCADCV